MNDSSHPDPLDVIAEEVLHRVRNGERPHLAEYTTRFPELADRIRDLFPTLMMVEQLGSPDVSGGLPKGEATLSGRRKIGEYQILREVGRGGMGIVYEAEQESLGRRVALKVLSAQSRLDPRQVQRFEREGRSIARLDHPNIVPMFAIGTIDDIRYLAMKFIAGRGLDEVIDEVRICRQSGMEFVQDNRTACPLLTEVTTAFLEAGDTQSAAPKDLQHPTQSESSARTTSAAAGAELSTVFPSAQEGPSSADGSRYYRSIARLGLQVARSLAYAHDQNVLHRDVKPSNLLLDTRGHVWLTDFGLAKLQNDDQSITRTGDFVGTLRYTSPEQLRGWADPRSDIYSLGITLYELLSLRPAFVDVDRTQLIARIAREEPPSLRRVTRQIPHDLSTIIHKAMHKEPQARYASADAFADDLERFLDYKPIEARPIPVWQRTRLWIVRNAAIAALGGMLALTMLCGLFGVSIYAVRANQARKAAERSAQRTQQILDTFIQSFQSPDPTEDGRNVLMVDVLGSAAQRLQIELADDPLAQADLMSALGGTYQSLGLFDEGVEAHQSALRLRQQELPADHPDTLSSIANLAAVQYLSGNLQEALALFKTAAERRRQVLGREHADTLKSMNDLAIGHARLGNWDQSIAVYEQTYGIMRRTLGGHHVDTLKCMANLGGAYMNHQQPERGLEMLKEALTSSRKHLGNEHPTTINTLANLAQAHADHGDKQVSREFYVEALALHRQVLGDEHPRTIAIAKLVASFESTTE